MTIDIKELEKHDEITSVSFDHENAHLAVTHAIQNGACSGWNTALLLKSDEVDQELIKALEQVTVTLGMEEFLRKFFDMYCTDAEILTKIMGYETEEEYAIRIQRENSEQNDDVEESYLDWYQSWLSEKTDKVTLLEKARDNFGDLDTDEKIKLLYLQESIEKGLKEYSENTSEEDVGEAATTSLEKNSSEGVDHDTSSEGSEEVSSAIGSDNSQNEINKSEGENISMAKQDEKVAEKTVAEYELEKAQEKIKELEKAQEALAELEKTMEEKTTALEKAQEKLVEFEKAENQRIEKGYTNFAETLSFVNEKEDLVSFLMKARESDVEGAAKFVEYLEKAAEAIKAMGAETGFEGAEDEEIAKASSHKLLDEKITQRYGDKKYL